MARFLLRRATSLVVIMFLVSVAVFLLSEAGPGDIAKHILGPYVTPEQIRLFRTQLGLDEPLPLRYVDWLLGTDWRASRLIGYPLVRLYDPTYKERVAWWADVDGTLTRWKMQDGNMITYRRMPDGTISEDAGPFAGWRTGPDGELYFWGVDTANRATLWKQAEIQQKVRPPSSGVSLEQTGGVQFIPLQRGLLRLDPGISYSTGRPVAEQLFIRLRNSLILAAIAFVIIMPLSVLLGVIAGLNEGKRIDRVLTLIGLITTSSPSYTIGIALVLIFAVWLRLLPGATVLLEENAVLKHPEFMVLPIATLALMEIGYVLRITRASVADVRQAPYVRTAFLKGLPYRRVVSRHILRNALLAPVTVIMQQVNWLLGGIVITEVLFGYPGLGRFMLDAANFNDVYSVEAGAMVMVTVAVGTQLVADVAYVLLNPRIRYS